MKKKYELAGMTCGGCVKSVKKAFLEIPDITDADVHLNPQTAELTMNNPIALEVLRAQLKKTGHYTISELVAQ